MINRTTIDYVVDHLEAISQSSFISDVKDAYVQLTLELKCQNIYVLYFDKFHKFNYGFLEESGILAALKEALTKYQISKSDILELLEIIQQCKPKIEEDCLNALDCSFLCNFSTFHLPEFMSSISVSLHSLLNLKADTILDEKVKIQSLTDNLDLFREVLEFTSHWSYSNTILNDFEIHTQAWVYRAACLSLLFWVQDVKEENMAARRDVILSDLQKTINPSNPEVTRMILAVLKASKPSEEDRLTAGRLVMKFVEFLKDNLQVNPETNDIQMLFLDLIFWITFLMDPKEGLARGKFILIKAAIVDEVPCLISAFCSDEIKQGITAKRNLLLQTFLKKAKAAKVVVRELCAHLFPDPSSSNFPSVNVLGFIDALLENLKEFCFHFPNYQILMLREELLSLRQSNLKDFSILAMQNKHKEIGDLWTRIVNVAYNAERAISSFIFIKDTLWYDILCLSDVIEEVELIKVEMKRIEGERMYEIHSLNSETSPSLPLPLQANILIVDKVFVGFNKEIRQIQDQLMGGSEELHIITIVGMPGLGKTTLAKKVYTDTSIQHRFHKLAWCTVSQQFNRKNMFLQILNDIAVSDDDLSKEEEEEDLEERICKSLRGQRYLIVLDDIWDVSAWDALRISFPEDNNGSRIMLTSRNHNVISKAKF